MCGRARCTIPIDDVGRAAGFRAPLRQVDSDRYRPSYNVAPGRYMPVVRRVQGGEARDAGEATDGCSNDLVVHCMKWGLIPSYQKLNEKPDHFRMFNARSESVALKPTFSRLLKKSRCVTTVEGFYEWKKNGSKRQPYYLHLKDDRPLVFAALYDSWRDEEGNILHTFTILTTRVSKALGWLHDRMPVILPSEGALSSWLNDELSEAAIHKLTQPYEASDLVWYPVTHEMGKPSFDGPECVQEIKPKVAKESAIFQLFGKRKNMENSSQEDKEESLSQVTETTKHQPSGDEVPASAVKDEDLETEEDRKALKAGMEPDQDVTESFQEEETKTTIGPQENSKLARNSAVKGEVHDGGFAVKEERRGNDFAVKREHSEENFAVKEEAHENRFAVKREVDEKDHYDQMRVLSPVKQTTGHEPEAKKRHVPPGGSNKATGRGGKAPLADKQRSLHSFFGKK